VRAFQAALPFMDAPKVLLIGWDAADWKVIRPLMDAGKMPNVQRLVANGATGQVATLHPPLSPMLWTSIATGKRPFKHGIHGFAEPTPDGRGVQAITNLSRKAKALWNILSQSDLHSVVVGWWPSHPAEPIKGVMVSDRYHRAWGPIETGWPLAAHTVHPPELTATLAGLRMHPDLVTPAMVEPFVPLAKEIDQDQDTRLALLLRTLAECMSVHAAASWLLENQPWHFFAVYYDALDHFCHGFMKYHPPRRPWIAERDFELYQHVVSMAYQFHDRLLGELLNKSGQDTTVILMSDHGFHPDHLRPASIPDIPAGPAIEHRDLGVLAISGPGIKKGESLYGPSVLDVAPTILTLFGLPVGEDMDGRVLTQIFVNAPEPPFLPSWEEVPGADGCHPPYTRLDPVASQAALEQMIALGYVERPHENQEIAVAKTIRELRYNLGEGYQDAGRHAEAHEIFAELYAADGEEQRFAVRLFVSCEALGRLDEMRRIVAGVDLLPQTQPGITDYLRARLLMAERRYGEALELLERVAHANPFQPGVFLETAGLNLRLHRRDDAQRLYDEALAIDPDNAHAHLGVCRLALLRRKFRVAAQAALDALDSIYQYPPAHFLLGRALTGMKEYERAAGAFRAAISFNPNFPEAHTRLASLLENHLGDAESARKHRLLARRLARKKRGALTRREMPPSAVWREAAGGPQGDQSGMGAPTAVPPDMPPLEECLVVVTGLPRSGTSMVMQMLAAGGLDVISDGLRVADEDNPRGYFEFEPVKNLLQDATWLSGATGKAIKILVPLLGGLPAGLACRVILCERDLEEVLDSQQRMLERRARSPVTTLERRRILKDEYRRTLARVEAMLTRRPLSQLLVVRHSDAIADPHRVTRCLNAFLGGGLDAAKMAAAIDTSLHRNRVGASVS
jgi:tetratricopeptide (TPR) repeat protein